MTETPAQSQRAARLATSQGPWSRRQQSFDTDDVVPRLPPHYNPPLRWRDDLLRDARRRLPGDQQPERRVSRVLGLGAITFLTLSPQKNGAHWSVIILPVPAGCAFPFCISGVAHQACSMRKANNTCVSEPEDFDKPESVSYFVTVQWVVRARTSCFFLALSMSW